MKRLKVFKSFQTEKLIYFFYFKNKLIIKNKFKIKFIKLLKNILPIGAHPDSPPLLVYLYRYLNIRDGRWDKQ